ncbi:MAG TPA: hypothetical protein VGS27_33220 [Candidatus Sulfotelmatobacter sp.]|nr:hypothetical protein [Candidatus Sulfotelmatobacter sp.]
MNFKLRALCLLCALCGARFCFSLDREAFSITTYDLNVQIEPEQHRLGARGKITLRNDTSAPQKIAVLQISSSLDWRAIRTAGKMLQFVTQPYTSDIDHTGSLSEALVTLPQEVTPKGTIDLDIAYEGVILLDATRLTRIGAPEDAARNTDWDRIESDFTGVRGAGYVAWYPIATDVANLSEGDSVFEALARWKAREAGAQARFSIKVSSFSGEQPPQLVIDEPACAAINLQMSRFQQESVDCTFHALGDIVPSFVIGRFGAVNRKSITIYDLPTHAAAAEAYADATEKIAPLIVDWFGPLRQKAVTADLPDPDAAPFESGAFLATPLSSDSKLTGLVVAHQLTHASLSSSRPWINEGLAHFAQALYLEQQKGRQAALDYMTAHRAALKSSDTSGPTAQPENDAARSSLINTNNEQLLRSKALCVWWMLRDMIGDAALKKAIQAYRPEQDKDPSYMPRLTAAQTQRDLDWFFDDWVYRDHGLPDFKVESAFSRKTLNNTYLLTITLENAGTAGAEVPVIIRMPKGESVKRIEVRAKSKTTVRVETPAAPQEIVVNDGSVPESRTGDNTFKVEAPQS